MSIQMITKRILSHDSMMLAIHLMNIITRQEMNKENITQQTGKKMSQTTILPQVCKKLKLSMKPPNIELSD